MKMNLICDFLIVKGEHCCRDLYNLRSKRLLPNLTYLGNVLLMSIGAITAAK